MFLLVTPLNFMLLVSYLSFFFFMLNETDVFVFWFFMELASLFFVGLSLCSFVSGFTGLLLYFLVQSISSLLLLVGLSLMSVSFCTVAFILKLGLFPFMFWYLPVVYSFSTLSFFLVLTFQKLPLLFLFSGFSFYSVLFDYYAVLFSSILAGLIGGVAMLSALDFRVLLILGSFSGTTWLLFSSFNMFLLFFFFSFYSLSLFLVLNETGLLSKVVSSQLYVFILLLSLCGLPPFPVFLFKLLIVFFTFSFGASSFLLFFLLLVSVLTVVGYFSWGFKFLVYSYSV